MPSSYRYSSLSGTKYSKYSSSPWSSSYSRSRSKSPKYSSKKAKVKDFLFMAEFGLVLESKKYKHKSAWGLLRELVHRLRKDKVGSRVESVRDSVCWTLLEDKSLFKGGSQHACELSERVPPDPPDLPLGACEHGKVRRQPG